MPSALKEPIFTTNAIPEALQRWYMVVDGNAHRPDLCCPPSFQVEFMLSEAMLPAIRTVACTIAAMRRDKDAPTPDVITDEADWFAARIVVLQARVFHLDLTLIPMLEMANRLALEFCERFELDFQPARIEMSLHAGRPDNMLIIETPNLQSRDLGLVANSLAVKAALKLPEIMTR